MKRLIWSFAAAAILAAPAAAADPRFAVVTTAPSLPSADVPNAAGSLVLPPGWETQASRHVAPSFGELQALWKQAGAAYGIPWEILGAINKIETNFGQNMGPSSAGAVGWMQFMPDTWQRWGMDANGDGVADPWNPYDAVHAAARYLAAAGARDDLYRGVYAYNHADWYVQDVLELAQTYARGGLDVTFGVDPQLSTVYPAVAEIMAALDAAIAAERRLARVERRLLARVRRARLLSDRLPLQKKAVLAGVRLGEAQAQIERLRDELAEAQAAATAAATGTWNGPVAMAVISPGTGEEVFPVGGGASLVSVARDHHDYPAADIAAPYGAPVVAHSGGVVSAAWPTSSGNCGIGFQLRADDGRTWTYCHLAYLESGVRMGVVLGAGFPVGAVGSTGRSTGPHLHLQLSPTTSYPQNEPWFQRFAGTAFRWQGEPAPSSRTLAAAVPHSVFAVVPTAPARGTIEFTR